MQDGSWSRRSALALGGAGWLAAATGASAHDGRPGHSHQAGGPLRFASPLAQMLAVIRVTGDLAGTATPWWYTGYIYGMRPGEEPRKLVRFEGCEIYRFFRQAEGRFLQRARTTTFFHDLASGKVLERWTNPYTGATVDVGTNLLGDGGRMVWEDGRLEPQFRTPDGRALPSGGPQPLSVSWTPYGDRVWMRHDRVYPPGLPQPIGESSAMLVQRADLDNGKLTAVPALFSSTYIARWLGWMGMKDQPGHTIWHADGVKLRDVEALPEEYLERVRRLHPRQLAVTLD
jgi:hypothetical protein